MAKRKTVKKYSRPENYLPDLVRELGGSKGTPNFGEPSAAELRNRSFAERCDYMAKTMDGACRAVGLSLDSVSFSTKGVENG